LRNPVPVIVTFTVVFTGALVGTICVMVNCGVAVAVTVALGTMASGKVGWHLA
jgi:hypothetical protein